MLLIWPSTLSNPKNPDMSQERDFLYNPMTWGPGMFRPSILRVLSGGVWIPGVAHG